MTGYYLYSKLWRSGVSAHIGTGGPEGAREEVGGPHPGLECSERVFGRLPADLHFLRVSIQAPLHLDEHLLMFPARHAPLGSRRTARFEGTRATVRGPVAIQREATFGHRRAPGQALVRRTPVLVQPWHVTEGFSVKPAGKVGGGCQRFGHDRNDARLVAGGAVLAF